MSHAYHIFAEQKIVHGHSPENKIPEPVAVELSCGGNPDRYFKFGVGVSQLPQLGLLVFSAVGRIPQSAQAGGDRRIAKCELLNDVLSCSAVTWGNAVVGRLVS